MKNLGIRLVVYHGENDHGAGQMAAAASDLFVPSQVIRCSRFRETAQALMGLLSGHGIVLIMIRTRAELARVAALGDRLRDHAVILVLDEAVSDLTRQALKLYPRYIGSFQDDHRDVLAVLEKMNTKIENTIKKGEDNG